MHSSCICKLLTSLFFSQAIWRGRQVRCSGVGRKVRAAQSRIPKPVKSKQGRSVGERTDETLTLLLGFTHVEPLLEYLVELGQPPFPFPPCQTFK